MVPESEHLKCTPMSVVRQVNALFISVSLLLLLDLWWEQELRDGGLAGLRRGVQAREVCHAKAAGRFAHLLHLTAHPE